MGGEGGLGESVVGEGGEARPVWACVEALRAVAVRAAVAGATRAGVARTRVEAVRAVAVRAEASSTSGSRGCRKGREPRSRLRCELGRRSAQKAPSCAAAHASVSTGCDSDAWRGAPRVPSCSSVLGVRGSVPGG